MPGLREQKKAQTRAAIAAAANDLFGREGYPNVPMARVAAAAGVSDQTLYNYFPTKESLVFDQSEVFEQTLIEVVVRRPAGVGLLEAYRGWLRQVILGDAARRALASPGGMPQLAATNDGLRRILLDLTHSVATKLALRLREDESLPEPVAFAVADAMMAISVRITLRIGAGQTSPAEAEAQAEAAIDALEPLLAHHV
jgi:AcrR family transcriptional regulator